MKRLLIVLIMPLAVAAGSVSSYAQGAASTQTKIGVIDIARVIANTGEGKKVIADLQTKYRPRQQDLQRLQNEIAAIQEQLTKQGTTLSREERDRLSRDLEEKKMRLKRTAGDDQQDFNRDRDAAIKQIGQKVVRVISDYGTQNGFALILDDAQIPIYFAAKEIELTAEIVKRYDAAYPVEEAVAPANPVVPPTMPTATSGLAEQPQTPEQAIDTIRNSPHAAMPPVQAMGMVSGLGTSIAITNDTAYTLWVYFSGPSSQTVQIAAHGSQSVSLSAGSYRVAGKVSDPSVLPFYGEHDYGSGTQYSETFYIGSKP